MLQPGVHEFDDGVKDRLYGSYQAYDLFFADQDGADGDDDTIQGQEQDQIVDTGPYDVGFP